MDFDYSLIDKDCKNYEHEIKQAYEEKDFYKLVCLMKFVCNFYYQINYKFTDDFLENITQKFAYEYLGDTLIDAPNENVVLFYDNFGLAARGLANIYINALKRLNYKIVWMLREKSPDREEILARYAEDDNITFEIIPSKPIMERIKYLQEMILKIVPKNIFFYTTPGDVEGVSVFSTIKGNVTRYLVDLTDHTFWLGKCAVDYIIGFRNFGANIALKYRNIEYDKIMILPFYPEKRKYYPYEGMPFSEDKEFIFSGGSVYKLEGDSTYEKMVVEILNKYPNLYFVYAADEKSEILDRIKEKCGDRFYQIPERKDLDEVLQHAKVYLSTYPESGGLMVQYALQNGCFPLNLCREQGGITDPHTWLQNPDKINFVFYSTDELYKKLNELLNDKSYYEFEKKNLSEFVITEEEFMAQLDNILKNKKTSYRVVKEDVNMESYLKLYRDRVTYERYCQLIYNSHNKWVWEKHPDIIKKIQKEK